MEAVFCSSAWRQTHVPILQEASQPRPPAQSMHEARSRLAASSPSSIPVIPAYVSLGCFGCAYQMSRQIEVLAR